MTESTVPFYEFHEYSELTSRTFRSLEEQIYLKKAQLKRQPNQNAAVLIPGQQVQLIKVATLRELPVIANQREEFLQRSMEAQGCYKSPAQAEAELTALEDGLLLEARSAITVNSESSPKVANIGKKAAQKPIWNRTASKA